MFICDKCGRNSKSGEKPYKRVMETREVTYINGRYKRKKVTIGREIVREANLCLACKTSFDSQFSEMMLEEAIV